MPKDYRERRIDNEPPRYRAKLPKRQTVAVNPEEPLPEGTYSTIVTLAPGDGVLWFLRLATADSSPSGRMVSIVDTMGGAVSHTYVTEPSGWTDYLHSFQGDLALDGAGIETVTDDTIYVVWDQFDGFTAGDYRLSWDIPATARASVQGAILLQDVDMSSQGDFYNGRYQSPTWEAYYPSGSPYITFPVDVPTANHSIVYGVWEMTGSVTAPAGYNTVAGSLHESYTYTDPTDSPSTITTSLISRIGVATGSTLTVPAPDENGKGVGAYTDYWFSAVVLHSATGITYTTVTFEA